MTDPWFRLYAGPDMMRGVGWTMWLTLFPARRLMDWNDEGCEVLAGLTVEVWARWRVFGRLRPGLTVRLRSDVDEVSRRIAERAGQFA